MLEHLDRGTGLTGNQYRIVLAGAIADMLNFYDFYLIGYILAFILGSWRLSYGQSACVLVASSLGSIPGALVWGRWADRVGRRKILLATALNISLASTAMALTPAQGWIFLAMCQFVFGFGFAGLHTVIIPLVQEFMPAGKRGWAGGMVISGISLAALLNAIAGAALVPLIGGWRGLAALGAAPLLAVVLLRAWVPESPRWLARQGRNEEARRALAWALVLDPQDTDPAPPSAAAPRVKWRALFRYPRSLAICSLLQLSYMAGGQALVLWSAALFVLVLRIRPAEASYLLTFIAVAGFGGKILWSYLSDRIGRRRAGAVACFGSALAIAGAAHFHDGFIGPVSVFWLLLLVQRVFNDGGQTIVQPYSAEVWPMSLRASGMGLAYAVGSLGRMVGILGLALVVGSSDLVRPQVTPAAIEPALLLSAGWVALSGLIYVLLAFETKGRSLEEIDAALRPTSAAAVPAAPMRHENPWDARRGAGRSTG